MRFAVEDGKVVSSVAVGDAHEGAPGFVHGGALAAILDDAASTVLMVEHCPAVTAGLDVRYRAPAFLGHELRVAAWRERRDGRRHHLRAEIRDAGDRIVAEGTALFIEVDPAWFEEIRTAAADGWAYGWADGEADGWLHERTEENTA